MPRRQAYIPQLSLDLPDEEAARIVAQEYADKTGREIVVTDQDGNEVCTIKPTPRRNQTIVRSKT